MKKNKHFRSLLKNFNKNLISINTAPPPKAVEQITPQKKLVVASCCNAEEMYLCANSSEVISVERW